MERRGWKRARLHLGVDSQQQIAESGSHSQFDGLLLKEVRPFVMIGNCTLSVSLEKVEIGIRLGIALDQHTVRTHWERRGMS